MSLVLRHSALAAGILSMGLFACGGSGDDDGGTIDPAGTNHTFVAAALDLPTNGAEAMALGLDIDDKPNDGVDNQLGSVLGSIGALAPSLNLQASLDTQVDQGGLILLTDLRAKDLTNSSGVGMWVYLGQTTPPPTPLPCTDANDTVCRHHLDGSGHFVVDPSGPTDAKLAGKIIGGVFTGGPGTVTLQISLAGGTPINLPLQRAKAEIHGISATGFGTGSKIGGAISQDDINNSVIPAIGNTVRTTFMRDCMGTTPPGCACTANSTGATLKNLFDKTPNDCMITDAEVMAVVSGFLTPDIDLNGDGTNDALSLGIGVTGVAGTYDIPAQTL